MAGEPITLEIDSLELHFTQGESHGSFILDIDRNLVKELLQALQL